MGKWVHRRLHFPTPGPSPKGEGRQRGFHDPHHPHLPLCSPWRRLPAPAAADTVAVTAAHLLDVTTGRTVDNPVVVVTDGHVTAAGAGVAIPAGARGASTCPA